MRPVSDGALRCCDDRQSDFQMPSRGRQRVLHKTRLPLVVQMKFNWLLLYVQNERSSRWTLILWFNHSMTIHMETVLYLTSDLEQSFRVARLTRVSTILYSMCAPHIWWRQLLRRELSVAAPMPLESPKPPCNMYIKQANQLVAMAGIPIEMTRFQRNDLLENEIALSWISCWDTNWNVN